MALLVKPVKYFKFADRKTRISQVILAQKCPSFNGIYAFSPLLRWICNNTNLIVFILVKYIYLVDLNIQYILLTELEGLG